MEIRWRRSVRESGKRVGESAINRMGAQVCCVHACMDQFATLCWKGVLEHVWFCVGCVLHFGLECVVTMSAGVVWGCVCLHMSLRVSAS